MGDCDRLLVLHWFSVLQDGLQLHFLKNGQEYIFTCPLQYLYTPFDPSSPVPTTHAPTSPQPYIQGHAAEFFGYSPYTVFHYLQHPHVYPPGPQSVHAPHFTSDNPPGPQPSLQQQLTQFLSLIGPEHILLSPRDHPEYPHYQNPLLVQTPSFLGLIPEDDSFSKHISKLPVDPGYLLPFYSSYYHAPPPAPTSEPQKPEVSQFTCPPNTETICGYYSYYNPFYQPIYPAEPWPVATPPILPITTPSTTSSAPSSPTRDTLKIPHLKCLMENMTVFLPSAQPISIQVRGQCMFLLVISFCFYSSLFSYWETFIPPGTSFRIQLRPVMWDFHNLWNVIWLYFRAVLWYYSYFSTDLAFIFLYQLFCQTDVKTHFNHCKCVDQLSENSLLAVKTVGGIFSSNFQFEKQKNLFHGTFSCKRNLVRFTKCQ